MPACQEAMSDRSLRAVDPLSDNIEKKHHFHGKTNKNLTKSALNK